MLNMKHELEHGRNFNFRLTLKLPPSSFVIATEMPSSYSLLVTSGAGMSSRDHCCCQRKEGVIFELLSSYHNIVIRNQFHQI